jgi:beta-glucosidase-like glycosyl hydrolase/CubicO group peptidase (beta-lactamase class C family)
LRSGDCGFNLMPELNMLPETSYTGEPMIRLMSKKLTQKLMSGIVAVFLLYGSATPALGGEGAWARKSLRKLSLREKIAQMMVYSMNMSYLHRDSEQWLEVVDLLETDGIGGIHLWYGEINTSHTMLNELQKISRIPILFDADIERGLGQRFPGSTSLPVLMAVGATGNPEYAYQAGRITALEGRAVGIHLNLTPVVDVNNNPANPIINTRSYGEDPDLVIEFSRAFIRGMKDNGILTTAKHFPGHGDTETDSHSNLAQIPSDSTRLWSVELPPFIAAIDQGVDLVMATHVQAPDYQIHVGTPATMSKFWVTDVLRDQLGFKGAVITDAMAMGGITQNFSAAFALIEAINAGCDIIIQNNNFRTSVDIVEKAVMTGIISEERINQAAQRMLLLKERAGLHKNRYTDYVEAGKVIGSREYQRIAQKIASGAITLIKDEHGAVPLRSTTPEDTIYVIDLYDYPFNHRLSGVTRRLFATGLPILPVALDESDPVAVYDALLERIPTDARILVNAFCSIGVQKDRIFLPDHQVDFIRSLTARTTRLIVTSFGTPYLIQAFPEIPTYLAAYHNSSLMQQALVGALLGNSAINGRLTITIPGAADRGTGIQLPEDSLEIMETLIPLPHLVRVLPEEIGVETSRVDNLLSQAVADSAWPGGVLLAARDGRIFIHESFGSHTYAKQHPTTRGDIFDLASVTKVVATTSAAMKLQEQGGLNLDDKVVSYLPEFQGPDPENTRLKSSVTIRHLLTHTSGLPGWRPIYKIQETVANRLDSLYALPLDTLPGTHYEYSCMGMITMGKVVERITGQTLSQFVQDSIFQRLGMMSTYFNPPSERLKRIVPTEFSEAENGFVKGHVHDENAHSLGGAVGNAGLFSTAADLAILSQMMLNGGVYRDSVIFQPHTVEIFTKRANVITGNSRCLGWDSPAGEASAGVYASSNSYGHTGFTGTSLWIDPDNHMFVILLTNAVHPHRDWKTPKYYDWRQRIHSAVYECFPDVARNPDLGLKARWATDVSK